MADEPHLKAGDSGEWVAHLQQLMNDIDPMSGIEVTSVLDEATAGKITFFQMIDGLPETGEADDATWAAITARAEQAMAPASDELVELALGEPSSEPTRLEVHPEILLAADGQVTCWAGPTEGRVAKGTQWLQIRYHKPDGSWMTTMNCADGEYPAGDLGPGDLAPYQGHDLGRISDDRTGPPPGQGYTVEIVTNPNTEVEVKASFTFDVSDDHVCTLA